MHATVLLLRPFPHFLEHCREQDKGEVAETSNSWLGEVDWGHSFFFFYSWDSSRQAETVKHCHISHIVFCLCSWELCKGTYTDVKNRDVMMSNLSSSRELKGIQSFSDKKPPTGIHCTSDHGPALHSGGQLWVLQLCLLSGAGSPHWVSASESSSVWLLLCTQRTCRVRSPPPQLRLQVPHSPTLHLEQHTRIPTVGLLFRSNFVKSY